MFRDDKQKCEAIRCLLLPSGIDHLWTETGPTDAALDLLSKAGGYLSGGQSRMLRVAFDVWNGDGRATLSEIIGGLDSRNLQNIALLMLAVDGATAGDASSIDYWIMRRRDGGNG